MKLILYRDGMATGGRSMTDPINTDKSAEDFLNSINKYSIYSHEHTIQAMEKYATLRAESAVKKAMDLVKAQEDYIKFLGEEYEGVHSIAYAHHYRTPETVFEKGVLMRETIKLLKAQLPSPSK